MWGKTPIGVKRHLVSFSNMTLQKYFWITSDIFVTSEYVISVLKYTASYQDTYQSGLTEFAPIFM